MMGEVSCVAESVLRASHGEGSRQRPTGRSTGIVQSTPGSLGVHSMQEGETQSEILSK